MFRYTSPQISVNFADRRDMDGNYRRMNVSTLAQLYPQVSTCAGNVTCDALL